MQTGIRWRGLKMVLLCAGLSLIGLALLHPRFRDADGWFKAEVCLTLSLGLASLVLAAGIAGRFRQFAFWLALALAGQAVALKLIDAGPRLHYQHYRPFSRPLEETNPWLVVCLGLQAVVMLAGLNSRWPTIQRWLRRHFSRWQILAIVATFVLSSAAVSREVPAYIGDLLLGAFVQAINLGNIALVLWALPDDALPALQQRLDRLFGTAGGEGGGRVDRFPILAALWVTLLVAALSAFVYERHPHLADEVGYLYHARYFAAGMLTMPAPPVPNAIDVDLMHYEADRWFSPVPPGWPAMLALGVLFGVPWLVNPILAGLNVVLAYVLLRELYDRPTARFAVLLLSVSPWYVFMAMNFMTHTVTLTCALAAALGLALARRTGHARWAWVSGAATGLTSLIRPLDGVVVAGLLALWGAGVGGRRLTQSSLAGFGLAALLVGGITLPYNAHLTGDPTVFPIMAYFDKYHGRNSNAFGFGSDRGMGWPIDPLPGHGPIDAVINANLNAFSLNVELFGWSTGSLLLIAIVAFSAALRRADYLMLAVIAAVIGIHTFYYFSGGPDFGARYWYLIIVPCAVLTARGVEWLARLESGATADECAGARLSVGVLSLCLLALINYFSWRAIDKYHHYLGMRPDIHQLAEDYSFGRSLVLVRGNRHPDYASAAIYNPLDLQADAPIYAWDRTADVRAQALLAYPDRPVWTIEGPSLAGNFRLVDGPRSAAELSFAPDSRRGN
jgi:4-amino-4-deoxy-L-arabinose transferase-like glycosyltransferase